VPNALQYTAIFITGDFPLVGFSLWGRIVNVINVLIAVGVVGIPAGIIADGYTDALQESREQEAAAKAAAAGDTSAVSAAMGGGDSATTDAAAEYADDEEPIDNQTESCCFGKGFESPQGADGDLLAKIHAFLSGSTRLGLTANRALVGLIVLNVIAVVVESVESAQEWSPRFWNVFEYISICIFTLEYIARIASAVHNPNCGYSRLVYATTFIGIVDMLSILPFYIQLFISAADASIHSVGRRLQELQRSAERDWDRGAGDLDRWRLSVLDLRKGNHCKHPRGLILHCCLFGRRMGSLRLWICRESAVRLLLRDWDSAFWHLCWLSCRQFW
jgi:hypothetical protein